MPCGGVRASRCGGFPCCGAQGLGNAGSVVTAHGLSSPVARGIFPDQGLNPHPCPGRQIPSHCPTREVLDLS